MKHLVILDDASEDLERGREFYDKQEPGLGDYFISSLYQDIASLETLHGFHSIRYGLNRQLASRFPYGIFYLMQETTIRVVAVLDLRRRPSRIQRQLKSRPR